MSTPLSTEQEVLSFWEEHKIYDKLRARKGKKFFLLDGPPYANDAPHVGHIKNTVFKDLVLRRAFMQGKQALFQPGFDTHGLPIENKVEKKLNLGSKKEIEQFGIDKFMQECRNNAAIFKDVWMKVYKDLGSLYMLKEPYLTYEDYYIESGWWAFSQMQQKGLVYEGERPVMWCPHCQTSLAGYEVTDSYKDVSDPGIYVLFKLKEEDAFLLVYTTTPWTLPANVAVAVAPAEVYAKVKIGGKKVILGEKRLPKLSELGFGYTILETFKGEKLVGKKYEPLLDVPLQRDLASGKRGKAHEVIASIALMKERVASKVKAKKGLAGDDLFEEFVTMNEGTGLVHTAPGHGKTDFIVGQHYGLACVSPVDEECKLTPESGFEGFVKKADKVILESLEAQGKLLYHEMITHSYPLCWRCKSPLIFRLSKQLFLSIEKAKKTVKKENKKVKWMPEFARERFENWVENAEDWNISRQRYWGIPIPLWTCSCGQRKVIESRKQLEELSGRKVEDLHTVERISLPCSCGKQMQKFRGILDVWFDSGIAPWASLGYPQQNKELFESHFPVDRINEAQDQIRGWFYSLMICSAAVFEKAPYKAVSMVGWLVDKNGDKMSKSVGNVISGEQALKELGADILRYYICSDIAPYEIQKFNMESAKKDVGGLFTILWNLQNLATTDKLGKLEAEDRWIISRLHSLLKEYDALVEDYEVHTATRKLTDFIINDFSRGYVRMTRDRDNGAVVAYCLTHLLRLLAPTAPFITEKMWQNLREKGMVKEESVHLALLPTADDTKINVELEQQFSIVLKLIEAGLAERDKVKVGLRWPLGKAMISCPQGVSQPLQEVIMRQLNVKQLIFTTQDQITVSLDTTMTPELEAEGFARELTRKIQASRKEAGLQKGELIEIVVYSDTTTEKYLSAHQDIISSKINASSVSFISVDKKPSEAIASPIKNREIFYTFRKLKE